MIRSQFVKDILDLLLDGDADGLGLRPQIDFLEETSYDYTGTGLFVYFRRLEGIETLKYYENSGLVDNVNIWSTAFENSAYAQIFYKDGFIDYLEIVANAGVYPKEELTDYMMRQDWDGSPQREIWCKDGKRNSRIV